MRFAIVRGSFATQKSARQLASARATLSATGSIVGIRTAQARPVRLLAHFPLRRRPTAILVTVVFSHGCIFAGNGAAGNASKDTPHLHFALIRLDPDRRWWKGTYVNPYPLLSSE